MNNHFEGKKESPAGAGTGLSLEKYYQTKKMFLV